MLRVITYNIHKGFDRFNRSFVLDRIRRQLHQADIDILLLQEVQGSHVKYETTVSDCSASTQIEFLANGLWPHFSYGRNAIYRKGHHGNAILSKYEISRMNNLNLSRFRRASRSLLHGRIEVPTSKSPLHLLCIHLDLIGFERKRQMLEVKQYIETHIPESEPLILGGDFNDWTSALGRKLEMQLGLFEAHHRINGFYAKTFPSNRPFLPMDRIFFRGIHLVDSYCLKQHPWNELSDHLPLYASFDRLNLENSDTFK